MGMDMLTETWKEIAGYNGLYQISTWGRIKSYKRSPNGKILSYKNSKGSYLRCNLSIGEHSTTMLIHRLVYITFVGNIPKGMDIDHIDGNKQNNHLDNLQCVSRKEHIRKTIRQNPDTIKGLLRHNQITKIKAVEQWSMDGCLINVFPSFKAASIKTGICERNIAQVANKTEYKPGKVRKQAGGYIWKLKEK